VSLNQNADAAIRSKAFGGSRQAIQDAATNTEYGIQGAQLAANLQTRTSSKLKRLCRQIKLVGCKLT